ncbi:hypothetical protein HAX39_25600 [Citrobacter freundii]|nr:hypothetical protein [Citrobacter freundii]
MEIKITVINIPTFCPVVDCAECDKAHCTANTQRMGRIEVAQAAYDEAEKALRVAEENLRMAVCHD